MTLTRKSIADVLDQYDDQIADLQGGKRDTLQSYRAQLTEQGMGKDEIKVEIEATKAAIKRRRAMREKGAEVIEHKDALVDEIFAEITGTIVATHMARGARADDDREARRRQRMSESMDDHKSLVDEMADAGLISEGARAENKALADAVARKFGNGPLPEHDADGVIIEFGAVPAVTHGNDRSAERPHGPDESTAARKDVPAADATAGKGLVEPERSRAAQVAQREDKTTSQAGTQAPPVDTHSEPEAAMLPQTVTATMPGPSASVESSATIQSRPLAGADEAHAPYHSGKQAGTPPAGAGVDEDRQPIPEPIGTRLADAPSSEAAAREDAGHSAPEPSNVTPLRTHNPSTHFLNSKGLPRLHGCKRPDSCGSEQARSRLCFSCSVQHDGPAHEGAA